MRHPSLVLSFLVVAAAILASGCRGEKPGAPPSEQPPIPDKPTSGLQRTVVVPTLDSPIPEGNNAIWCATFQLAWDQLNALFGAPADVAGAQETVGRLNRGSIPEHALVPDTHFEAAGRIRDGILDRIRAEMKRRFPHTSPPTFEAGPGLVAYAYAELSVPFPIPYFGLSEPIRFESSAGKLTEVTGFGLEEEHANAYYDLRRQPVLLFAELPERPPNGPPPAPVFAVDLEQKSSPLQIILAVVPRKASLAELVAFVDERLPDPRERAWGVGPDVRLRVPNIDYRLVHRFSELEGPRRKLRNPGFEGLYLAVAAQTIRFRLDKHGADLESEAKVYPKAASRLEELYFNRPFLVMLRKRGASKPLFAMWVDNEELLTRR